MSERFPTVLKHKTTVSVNSTDTSVSKSEQSDVSISPATIATLSSGEFVGILADDPDNKMELKAFHANIIKESDKGLFEEVPIVREVSVSEMEECFRQVKKEVADLVEREIERITSSPVLKQYVVRN